MNKKLFSKRSVFINLYTLLSGVIIIGFMAGVGFCVVAIIDKNSNFLLASLSFTLSIIITLCISAWLYRKSHYGKSPLIPYEFESKYHSGTELLKSFSEYLSLHVLPEAVCCARAQNGNYYTHWFVYYLPKFDSLQFKQLETRSVLSAMDAGIVPAKMSRDTFLHSSRCNVIVTDSMNENLSRFIHGNAVDRISSAEGIVDCVVVISNSKIYIPALWGGYTGHLNKYRRLIRELTKIIDVNFQV